MNEDVTELAEEYLDALACHRVATALADPRQSEKWRRVVLARAERLKRAVNQRTREITAS